MAIVEPVLAPETAMADPGGGFHLPPGMREMYDADVDYLLGAQDSVNAQYDAYRARNLQDRGYAQAQNLAASGMPTAGQRYGLGGAGTSGWNQRQSALTNTIRNIGAAQQMAGFDRHREDLTHQQLNALAPIGRQLQALPHQYQDRTNRIAEDYLLGAIDPIAYALGRY